MSPPLGASGPGEVGPSALAVACSSGDSGAMERACIVVGVDGSAAARQAVLWAAGLGPVLGAEVVAVHAVGLLEDLHDATEEPAAWRARVLDRVTHT